ncbi:hypothetical protein [Sphingomonas oryzagri]
MSYGRLDPFPGTFATGRTLPPLSRSPFALQRGALLFIDPTDPDDPWAPGVPASGTGIKNLACWAFADMVGNPGIARYADYQPSWVIQRQAANELLLERTAKGGLHGLPSQVNNGTANRGAYLRVMGDPQTYIYNNPAHAYFYGLIGAKTRDRAGTTAFPRSGSLRTFTSANNTRNTAEFNGSTASAAGSVTAGSHAYQNPDGTAKNTAALGSFVTSTASTAWANTGGQVVLPTGANDIAFHPFFFGTSADNVGALNACHGLIVYAAFAEDLTVSGRAFADVQAQWLAFGAAQLGAGGRWAGDTYTDPATFP